MKINKKIVISVSSGILAAIIIYAILTAVMERKSIIQLKSAYSSDSSRLIAYNGNGHKGTTSNYVPAYFGFTEAQKEWFNYVREKDGSAALVLRLKLEMPQNRKIFDLEEKLNKGVIVPFVAGFLGKDAFTASGKVKTLWTQTPDPVAAVGHINDFYGKKHSNVRYQRDGSVIFDLSLALSKNPKDELYLPEGFYIESSYVGMKLLDAAVVPANLGFDFSDEIPFFGYGSTGGIINFEPDGFDFTGASEVFPVAYSENGSMPDFELKFLDNFDFDEVPYITSFFDGENLKIKKISGMKDMIIPSAGLKSPFGKVDLKTNRNLVTALIMKSGSDKLRKNANNEVIYPIKTDPGLILNWKLSNWRTADYEIYQWDRFDGILFFDIRNYDIQDNFFRRMAYFVEKEGYRGTLVSDEELKGKHGYNAHDYSADSMTAFFNKAYEENFPLLTEEKTLEKILLENGLLILNEEDYGKKYKAGKGGIVSISRESQPWLRTTLLAHEGWHTLFFRDEEFRNFTAATFYTIDPYAQEFVIDYFKSQPNLGYDTDDTYLLHNEFMAYIMQQPSSGTAAYFVHCAERGSVMNYTPELARYVRETKGRAFEDAAFMFDDYVRDRWGIVCGNISLLNR